MTVSSVLPIKTHTYTGAGVYGVTYPVFDTDTIFVRLSLNTGDIIDLLAITDFTVALLPEDGGANITILTTDYDATGVSLEIRRILVTEQTTEWDNGSSLDMPLLTQSFDKVIMLMQQLKTDIIAYSASTNWRGSWGENQNYILNNIVEAPTGSWYVAVVEHTSNDFNSDLVAGKWLLVLNIQGIIASVDSAVVPSAPDLATLIITETGASTIYLEGRVLKGDGGEGLFHFSNANLTSEVTSDSLKGIYVPPYSDVTGASGAWVRQNISVINPRWFGTNQAALQAAVSLGSDVQIDNNYSVSTAVTLHSNLRLHGKGGVTRTDSTKDIFQAVGTQSSHITNIRIDGLHFADSDNGQDGGTSDTWPTAILLAYCDDIAIHGNSFYNINLVRTTVSAAHSFTDDQAAYASIDDMNLNKRIHITNNSAFCDAPSAGASEPVLLTYTKDFIVSNNSIIGYSRGINIIGGFIAAVDLTEEMTKSYNGIISNNIVQPVNVGIYLWGSRDVEVHGNTVKDATHESLDVESCINIFFKSNVVKNATAQAFAMFYNNLNIQVTNNSFDLGVGGLPIYHALMNEHNGDLFYTDNIVTSRYSVLFSTQGTRHLVIEDNEFLNVIFNLYGGNGNIDFNNNKLTYSVTPGATAVIFGNGVLSTVTTADYEYPALNFISNSLINRTGSAIATGAIQIGGSATPCFYNIIKNSVENFGFGINFPNTGFVQDPDVLHKILIKENKFATASPNTVYFQQSPAATEVVLNWVDNTDMNGVGGFNATTPHNSCYYSVGSRNYLPAPTAGGAIGSVCTASGGPGTWKTFGAIAS